MEETKKTSVGIPELLFTFAAVIGTFLFYITQFMAANPSVASQVDSLLQDADFASDKVQVFLYMTYAVCALAMLFVGFIIYKMISNLCSCKIQDGKLLLAVGSSYAVSFLISALLVNILPFWSVILISNVTEALIVFSMCFSDIQKKIGPALLLRAIIIVLNLAVYLVTQ